ncbi:flagellar basal body-associated FliL family protein [Consotaella aegiceratis]|uniref:flagellar basal body-associated FliL family protein n=1 Tax=Consotaella aegiceratis TaxID=3097961 RepID=UPI002F3E6CE7
MTDTSADGLEALNAILEENKPKKSGSLMPMILTVVALTAVAVAGGAGIGFLIGGSEPPAPPAAEGTAEAGASEGHVAAPGSLYGGDPEAGPILLVPLEPIVTNLYSPSSVLLRMQASIVVRENEVEDPDVLAARIGGDMLAYLRTVQLPQLQGARGLLHLREDLTERAKLRSPAVLDFIIETMVAE